MPLNVLILEFFSLYFHFSSFLRGKIDTNKRLCLVFRNVLTFRIEIDESKKTFCDIKCLSSAVHVRDADVKFYTFFASVSTNYYTNHY